MSNPVIDELINKYSHLKSFILVSVSEIMYDSDKDSCSVEFHNSNLFLKFRDFDITIDENYSIKIKNENRYFDRYDFEKFHQLNARVMSYSVSITM